MQIKKRETLNTDILIIGGGTAGCYAALTIAEKSGYSVLIAEKANIKRSGCLAAGVNVSTHTSLMAESLKIMLITQRKTQTEL